MAVNNLRPLIREARETKSKKKTGSPLLFTLYDKQLHKNYTLYVICCF